MIGKSDPKAAFRLGLIGAGFDELIGNPTRITWRDRDGEPDFHEPNSQEGSYGAVSGSRRAVCRSTDAAIIGRPEGPRETEML